VSQQPDSALTLLREIPSSRSLKDKELAQYGWIKSQAHYNKNQSLIDDTLVVYSLDYYKVQNDTSKLRSLYEIAAKYYYAQKDYVNSDRIWEEGIEWAKSVKDSTSVARFYVQRANTLHRLNPHSTDAGEAVRNSLQYKENAGTYYNIVIGDRSIGEDSIRYFLQKSVEIALQNKDTTAAAFYLRNIASVMAERFGKYNEAKEILWQAMSFQTPSQVPTLEMTYICLDLGEIDSAEYYLNKTKEVLNLSKLQGYHVTSPGENSVALAQAVIDYSRNKKLNARDIGRYNDSVFFAMNDQYKDLQAKTETKYNLEKENMQLTINQQQLKLWLMAVLMLILIIGIVVFFYIRSRKRKLLEVEENMEALDRLLKEATENTEADNDSRFFKKILLQQLGLIKLVAAVPTSGNQELLRQMSEISNRDIPADTLLAWDDLYPIVDSVYNNFHSDLTSCYGNVLIEKEIQLCCLLCAGFSTKEIQVVTQQSIPTIYQRKTTIRKKLRIGEKEDIITFLNRQFQG
jgi:DNA-binding CsgD family transcriptional regulator/tetratricopeptide (TPR) repeat protein